MTFFAFSCILFQTCYSLDVQGMAILGLESITTVRVTPLRLFLSLISGSKEQDRVAHLKTHLIRNIELPFTEQF